MFTICVSPDAYIGSGYQAAILAEICQMVYTVEIFESLGEKVMQLFSELGYNNIKCKIGDGYKGWPQYAPYDAIIVTCSPTHIPKPLKDQLAISRKKESEFLQVKYSNRFRIFLYEES